MASQSIINEQLAERFREVWDLWDKDHLEECEAKARSLLEDEAIPNHYRIKTLMLLGSVVEDYWEAERFYRQADTTWRWIRRGHAPGKDAAVDELLRDLRVSLDVIKDILTKEEVEVDARKRDFGCDCCTRRNFC